MEYRTHQHYNHDAPNESRADQIEHALTVAGDRNGEQSGDVRTDVIDLLASVRHFCDRVGLDYDELNLYAARTYDGDGEDDEPVRRDVERFPGGVNA